MQRRKAVKKIVFVVEGMYLGGVETTLINWLKTINIKTVDVTLMLKDVEGELLKKVPKYIKIERISGLSEVLNGSILNRIRWVIKDRGIFAMFKLIVYVILFKITKNKGIYYSRMINFLNNKNVSYDIAISYSMPDSIITTYVVNKINSKNHWMWCHVDIDMYDKYTLKGLENIYNKYDKIVNVSEYAKQTFEIRYPYLKKKSVCVLNIVNVEEIISKSLESVDLNNDDNEIFILTVGRINPQKGQDLIIDISKKLKKLNIKFKWYLLGPAQDKEYLKKIENHLIINDLSDTIIYLGKSSNPYKYIKKCDIYVQPSRYEGFCTTITEAKVLAKPIVMTNVSGAKEQIDNYKNGIIVEFDATLLCNAIKELINNGVLREKMINNLIENRKNINKYNSFDDVMVYLLN